MMSDSLADKLPLPDVPPAASVLENIPCRMCGYNLRTLARNGICPECAAPVADSLHVEFLRAANPQWLKKIRISLRIVSWSLIASYLMGKTWWIGRITFQDFRWAADICVFAGLLFASARNPAELEEGSNGSLRRGTRALAFAWICDAVLNGFQLHNAIHLQIQAENLTMTLEAILQTFSIALLLVYLRGLALRIPHEEIAGGLKRSAWAYVPINLAGPLMSFVLVYLQVNRGWRPSQTAIACYNFAFQAQLVSLVIFLQAVAPFAVALKSGSRR
jgi:hypothetical protein